MTLEFGRIGFAGIQLAGDRGWGPPADRDSAKQLLRDAVEAGVSYIDTADVLGPDISEQIIAETLFPYPSGVTVATKVGATNAGPGRPGVCGHPTYLRQQVYASAFRLRLETIPLVYLHRVDPSVPLEDQIGAFAELKQEGVVGNVGLSAVGVDTLRRAAAIVDIAAVQNPMSVHDRTSDDVVTACAEMGATFVAFWCFGRGRSALEDPVVIHIANELGFTPAQVALAWLFARSPSIVALPGTKKMAHLRANLEAAHLPLPESAKSRLDGLWRPEEHVTVIPLD